MLGGPDIAVEIVSRESRQRDYGEKKQLYAESWGLSPRIHRDREPGLTSGLPRS
jgi:Uma2 family endonuclease